mmetsp:Transcript_45689/g.52806  ORF Transcript_45689/g.52806 Transcript_45689/m.52806 type:complete len:114 (+) Transcript_45689:90-431(+)
MLPNDNRSTAVATITTPILSIPYSDLDTTTTTIIDDTTTKKKNKKYSDKNTQTWHYIPTEHFCDYEDHDGNLQDDYYDGYCDVDTENDGYRKMYTTYDDDDDYDDDYDYDYED